MDVSFSHIEKRFGPLVANKAISLRLTPGRIHGLLGENGAGKSTLMRVLCGRLAPDAGSLLVDGRRYARLTPNQAAALGIGMLPQDPVDFPNLRVWENFALSGGRTLSRRQALARLDTACRRLGFDLPPELPTARLGVARRQQLELARLFDGDVRLLILDEPTTGIAPDEQALLFTVLRQFVAKGDRLAVLVTHKLAEAKELCDDVFVLRQGSLAGRFQAPLDRSTLLAAMFGAATGADLAGPTPSPPAPPQPGPPLVRLEDVAFVRAGARLDPVRLEIRPGEIIALAGVTGSGQALFLRGLAGLARIAAGRLTVAGKPMTGRGIGPFLQAGIRFLPAARLEEGLFPGLTLAEHLRLAFPGRDADVPTLFASRCVATFRLPDTPDLPAAALSGGNQQRLLLALGPDSVALLLAEGPTRGLDLASHGQVWQHLRARAAAGAAVVFASDDLDEIQHQARRVLVFFNRRLVADVTDPREIADTRRLGQRMTGGALAQEARP